MKVGTIVDGQAEVFAVQNLFRNIPIPNVQLLKPLYADMQPRATPHQIARAARGTCTILRAKSVDLIVVLIDHEDRDGCPSVFAGSLRIAFADLGIVGVEVVVKHRKLENWLVGDPDSLQAKMMARMKITSAFKRAVVPNKADRVDDAVALLNSACVKQDYHKRSDAQAIARAISPNVVASNSRSFRRFLRIIGHSSYATQSRLPLEIR